MTDTATSKRRLFTVEEANAMLPLVRAIVGDLSRLSKDVVERRERLGHLAANRDTRVSDAYSEEVAEIEAELERDAQQLFDYVEELRQLGVEPKNGPEGLVDFPAMMDDRIVYLCWRLDEPEVLFWHDIDAGFAGRQSLTADVGVDGGVDAGDDERDSGAEPGHD
ncbi:MAG: DUF2203 domain-containing protein [Pirellulales bacterium]